MAHFVAAENDLMVQEIRRLEYAIQATDIPTHIARDCLGTRQRRIDTDLVQDNTENQLLKVCITSKGVILFCKLAKTHENSGKLRDSV